MATNFEPDKLVPPPPKKNHPQYILSATSCKTGLFLELPLELIQL